MFVSSVTNVLLYSREIARDLFGPMHSQGKYNMQKHLKMAHKVLLAKWGSSKAKDGKRGRGLLVCVEGPVSDWTRAFLEQFINHYPRDQYYFIYPLRDVISFYGARDRVIPYPFLFASCITRYIATFRSTIILIDAAAKPPERFISRAKTCGVTVVRAESLEEPVDQGKCIPRVSTSVAGSRRNSREEAPEIAAASDPVQMFQSLTSVFARDPIVWVSLLKRIRQFLAGRLLPSNAANESRRLSSISDLASRLGNPRRILCLGNGPSSEDRELTRICADAVFRVNHRWIDRGIFVTPDVVFTGSRETVEKIDRDAVFVFPNENTELRRVRQFQKKQRALTHMNCEQLGFFFERFESFYPTNGLLMLYVALKLNPEELIVAGIDFFEDSRGTYPGVENFANAYTGAHNRTLEKKIIVEMLKSYSGKLTIISGVLSQTYEQIA